MIEPQDGLEALALRLFARLSPKELRAYIAGLERHLDGQPLDEALIEVCVELGDPPDRARRLVRQAIEGKLDVRSKLN
jgi:hypothetical protein